MEDECAITHEPEESPTVRYRLLIGLMRVLLGAEADYGGSAGASPYRDDGIMAARREPRPTKTLATGSDSDRRIRARDSVARSLHYTPGKSCRVPRTLPTKRDGSLPVHVAR
jgi:hypothetical protein